MDQLVGTSGEQLPFAVMVGKGTFAAMIFPDMAIYVSFNGSKHLFHGLSVVSVLIAVYMMECCHY